MGHKLLKASRWMFNIGLVLVLSLAEINSHILSGAKIQLKGPLVNHGARPRPRSIVVRCQPDSMEVVVQADMFNTGLRVDAGHLRLGLTNDGGACRAFPSGEAQYTIQAQLMTCGTKLSSTKQKIIYSNVLVYSPELSSEGLHRLDGATVPVKCYYERRYAVEGLSLHPTWIPFVSRASAVDHVEFHLRLMSDDWQSERGSYAYFLGDPINFEASVVMANHVPLRLYVDHCVATTTPDAEAALRYDFINNYGCLADAYLTNSSSHFLSRVEEHTLRFQIDAFRFYGGHINQVYITCYMKAVPANVTSHSRACSLIQKRWRSVDGNHHACRSCDISHHAEELLATERPTTTAITRASSGTTSRESYVKYISFYPGMHQSQHNKPLHPSGTDYRAERTVQLGPLTVLTSGQFASRPTDSKSIT